mmetsp:Transcript_2123/g.4799  ORF Transcript_2123/g.4799 Transcript_2123/m.4799 type:complete len:225 (-) Transcript_2123:380-1054(-)
MTTPESPRQHWLQLDRSVLARQAPNVLHNGRPVVPEVSRGWVGSSMPQLHLEVADDSEPQHLLRASAGVEVVPTQAETAAVYAHALADTGVHVDAEAHHLHIAVLVLVSCELGLAVPVRMELTVDERHAPVVAEQQVARKQPHRGPGRAQQWLRPDLVDREEGLRELAQGARDVRHPPCPFCVRLLALSREEVRYTVVKDGDLEQAHPGQPLVRFDSVQAAGLH